MRTTSFAAGLCGLFASTQALADDRGDFAQAVAAATPILDYRLRYETVDQDGFSEDASAVTSRLRVGFETGSFKATKLLVDVEHIEAHEEQYNSTINGEVQYPVVPDPEGTELNRFQLTNTSLASTTFVIGRQRIIHDDARFVGNVGWRQNEQTFDALRVVHRPAEGLTIDAAFIAQVNRIFGDRSPMGRWESNSLIADVDYRLGLQGMEATVSGFAYLLDFDDDAPGQSSQTYGASAEARAGSFSGRVRGAWQTDYADRQERYAAGYASLEGTYHAAPGAFTAGAEILGSDDDIPFSTPLATLHKFDGYADVFLSTPAEGVRDVYAGAAFDIPAIGPFNAVKVAATYHDFADAGGGDRYGQEVDALLSVRMDRVSGLLKLAHYRADELATDRTKLWLQFGWSY
ncbi:hypothetical protein PB2503_13614 [Parvularcula bermudensis HTCC2503]|uniref:Alginate export domain-containing protein n=1 Tax=Parvularcula bermudensis (strain ATCC BAA-594 / HTCC2503 / KCTC 12087) TaxID=314260 RepID=E0THG8_PARBH|nr:hypothetical protein [Parvularcula bermudensis]ADM10760.1 hypothetical protein PB2503_13614 [Parvularcula bermudensis HTCC2503]